MPLIQKTLVEPDIVLVEVAGRIALGRECQVVEWTVEELIADSRRKVVFDLSKLEYLDSTGVGIIATCCGRMEAAGGEVRLASLQPKIEDLMRLTKLNRILNLHPTVADALRSFGT
jgi:anti-anti-sigma factor